MVTSIGIWPPWAWRRTVRSNMYLRGARKPSNNWTVLSYLEDSWSLEMEGRGGLDWIQHCRHFGQWDWNTYFHHVLILFIHVHIFYWYLISVFVNALTPCARHLVGVAMVEPQWLELLLLVGHGENREGTSAHPGESPSDTNSTCRTPETLGKPRMATLHLTVYLIYFNIPGISIYFNLFESFAINASLFPRPLPWARPAAACCTMARQWSLTSTREGRHDDRPGRGQPERFGLLLSGNQTWQRNITYLWMIFPLEHPL